ncbi:MAG: hypothetical protein Kow0075_08270 [Salibacteraceae bacterium]
MRLLYFSHSFPSPNTRFIRDELEHFNKGHEVTYLSTYPIRFETNGINAVNIPFEQSALNRKWNWLKWKYDLDCTFKNKKFKRKLGEFVEKFKPDIIHCHFAYEGLTLYQNLEADVPVIFHFHGYDASQMLRKNSYVTAMKQAFADKRCHPIYVSENIREKLKQKGLESPRSTVIYYGVSVENFSYSDSVRAEGDRFHFLHISNLQEKKGVDYSIKAFGAFLKRAESPEIYKFLIAGSGPLETELKELTKSLGLESYVEFLGIKSRDEVIALMDKSHVFVHHSITAKNGDQEGIPNVIIEAMAKGMPVLATHHSGIPELVQDGVHGYLVKERDVDALAAAMHKISSWKNFRIEDCAIKVRSKFSKEVHIQQLTEFYNRILAD